MARRKERRQSGKIPRRPASSRARRKHASHAIGSRNSMGERVLDAAASVKR
jgi:hypothetical protein